MAQVVSDPLELFYRLVSIDLVYRVVFSFGILVGTYIVGRMIQKILRQALRKAAIPRAEVLVVSTSSKYIILFVGVLAALEILAIPIVPFLGAFGILALMIGLASRSLMESLISGFLLTASRPFEIGDIVMVGDIVGEVIEFDLMTTYMRTEDDIVSMVPNSTLVNSGFTNITAWGRGFKVDLTIKISYDSDLESTRLGILDIISSYPMLSRDQPVSIDTESIDEQGVSLSLGFFVPRFYLRREAASQVIEGLLQANREGKIRLAYEEAVRID